MTLGTGDQPQVGIRRRTNHVALEELLGSVSAMSKPPAPLPLSFREIGYGYRTGESFWYSVILHQLVLIVIVLFSRYTFLHSVTFVAPQLDKAIPVTQAIYLPGLGGGSEGTGKQGGGSGSQRELSSGVRARGRRGFAYPGPQPVVSDPPHATLGIETILRPSLKNLPLLRRYLPIPDLVQAPPATEPPKSVINVQPETFVVHSVEKPLLAPKLNIPSADLNKSPVLAAIDAEVPRVLPVPPLPSRGDMSHAPADNKDDQGLLALNAIPPELDLPTRVPMVEARSLFAITPGDVTVIADPASGAKSGGLPSITAGSGTRADLATGDAIADSPAGGRRANGAGASGTGDGGRYGGGIGTGLNSADDFGVGRGKGSGAGAGATAGTRLGSGNGVGSASDKGGFPGITIRGGRYGNGTSDTGRPRVTARRQTSYGMTITSTASSGGGLPDLGVFHNEKVYTVYLDMRINDEDAAPSWTLQYAVSQPMADNLKGDRTSSRIVETLTPPYAMLKEVPELTPELATRCAGKLIIASAIMNVMGKLEQVSVKQTPDSQLAALLVEALNHWSFQPAEINGNPVALKILLGIRLRAH